MLLCGARSGPVDADKDGIPDHADPFPDDPDRPGRTKPGQLYANTASELFEISGGGRDARAVGRFSFADGRARQVTDIAIDRYGVMYAISFDALLVCDPSTARCETLFGLLDSHNALAVVPGGDEVPDRLVAATTAGGVRWMDREKGPEPLLALPGPSSGDLFAYSSNRIVAARDTGAALPDRLDEFSAAPPSILRGRDAPGMTIYGLARCGADIYAFDENGTIHLSPGGGSFVRAASTVHPWWGAACSPMQLTSAPVEEPRGPEPPPPEPEAEPEPEPPAPGCACR